jgi:hypothetical protein
MSHEIETPTLTDLRSGEVLVSFQDTNWSLDAADWLSDSVVKLTLRKYPGAHFPIQLTVVVDCLNKIADLGGTRLSALAQLEHKLDQSLSPIPVLAPTKVPNRSWTKKLRKLLGITTVDDSWSEFNISCCTTGYDTGRVQYNLVVPETPTRKDFPWQQTTPKPQTSVSLPPLIDGDGRAVDHLLSDDFILVDVMSGSIIDKPSLISIIDTGQLKFESIEPTDILLRQYDTTAVITKNSWGQEPTHYST